MADTYFGITDTGRLRDQNEDTFIAQPVMNNRFIAACAIDGVGGYEGGEVAAAIARESILEYLHGAPSADIPAMIKEAFFVANEKIQIEKLQKKEYISMACVVTLALADIQNNVFYYAHVGDTRLYLLRDGSLVKVTKDHSFVGFLEDSGRLSEEQAMYHPKRNEINRALGFDSQIRIHADYIDTGESPFLPGDMILLCSDGLTDMIGSREITSLLNGQGSLEEKATALVAAANSKGGKDNITVVLVHNNTKPVKQSATKPAASAEKNGSRQNNHANEENTAVLENENPPPRQSHKAVAWLSLLCLLLLAALIWLWFQKPGPQGEEVVHMAPAVKKPSVQEVKFSDTLSHLTGKTLLLSDSGFQQPVYISDTLYIRNDSLHLRGVNNVVLIKDSAYEGPGIMISPASKYMLLENITLENFDVGIQVHGKGLRLKNVRFRNCRIPVQYSIPLPDNTYLTGKIDYTASLKTDSIPR